MYKLEDTMLPTNLATQGIYQVGNKYFYHKLNALIESSRTKQPVHWDFHSKIFQQQALKPKLDVPVSMLYHQRAQQLRDQYDYLILAYSGGADSDQMLRSFVLNGVHIDEVWCDWPHQLVEKSNWRWDGTDNGYNIHMEYLAVVKPTLAWLQKQHPEIKIHQSDSVSQLQFLDSPEAMLFFSDAGPAHYHNVTRYAYINQYVSQLRNKGKNVAVIIGIDKCVPHKQGHDIGFCFHDYSIWVKNYVTSIDSVIYEYFFWSPNMPEIATEQAHKIWDVLKLSPEQTHRWLNKPPSERVKRGSSWFDDVVKFSCYPDWDRRKFQVPKTTVWNNTHYGPMLRKYTNEMWYQSWASTIVNTFIKPLDPKIAWRDGVSIKSELAPCTNFIRIGTVDW